MQSAHILNLGTVPPKESDTPAPPVEDEFSQTRNLIEETRSDVRRMRTRFDQQEDEHEAHRRRTKVLSIILGVLLISFVGLLALMYPSITNQRKAIADMLGMQNVTSSLGARVDSVEGGLSKMLSGLPALNKRMDDLQTGMKTNLQTARTQAQAIATQMSDRIRQDVSKTVESIQSRLAGVESNQKESAERVTQLQEQIAGLQRELVTVREDSAAKIKQLTDAQLTSTSELAGLNQRISTSQTALSTLSTRLDRDRMEFQVASGKSAQISPDVTFTVKRIDAGRQQFDGTLRFGSNGQSMLVHGSGIQQPIAFYLPNESRPAELVLTEISKKGISGYLMMPTTQKSASQ